MARKLPDPAERTAKDPAVLCDSDRVLALFNRVNALQAQRVSKTVKDWFVATALQEGWDAAFFIKHVETAHSAGCVLYKRAGGALIGVFIGDNDDDD